MQSFMPAVVVAGLIGAISITPSTPQDPARPMAEAFVLEAGQHNIRQLIDKSAAYLGRNYIYSEADIKNAGDLDITLQNRLTLDRTGCEEVVSQLAYSRSIVMLPVDQDRGIYEWVHRFGQKRDAVSTHALELTPAEVLAKRQLRIQVRSTIPLKNSNANNVANQLRPFFSKPSGMGLMVGVAGTALLIEGPAHTVATAVEMIEKTDGSLEDLDPGLLTWKTRVDQRLAALEKQKR